MGIIKKNYYAVLVANALNEGLTYDPYLIDKIMERLGFCLPFLAMGLLLKDSLVALNPVGDILTKYLTQGVRRQSDVRQCNNKQ